MGRGDACEERRTKLKAHSTINELPQQSVALEKYYNLAEQCRAKATAATEKALRMPARTYLEAHRRQAWREADQAIEAHQREADEAAEALRRTAAEELQAAKLEGAASAARERREGEKRVVIDNRIAEREFNSRASWRRAGRFRRSLPPRAA